jgi:hypothetical protein
MATPKQPQDHKKPAGELYSFEYNGDTYTFESAFAVIATPKWLRANRRRDELDLAFTIIEELAGDEALEAIDAMTQDEFKEFSKDMNKALSSALEG